MEMDNILINTEVNIAYEGQLFYYASISLYSPKSAEKLLLYLLSFVRIDIDLTEKKYLLQNLEHSVLCICCSSKKHNKPE